MGHEPPVEKYCYVLGLVPSKICNYLFSHVIPNLNLIILLKMKYILKNVCNQTVGWKSITAISFWVISTLQNIIFCARKIETCTGLEQHE